MATFIIDTKTEVTVPLPHYRRRGKRHYAVLSPSICLVAQLDKMPDVPYPEAYRPSTEITFTIPENAFGPDSEECTRENFEENLAACQNQILSKYNLHVNE